MKKVLVACLLVLGSSVFTAPVQAFGHGQCDSCCPPPPVCTPCVTWVEKTVTCMKPEWRERDVVCQVNHLIPREVVTPMKRIVMVPEWKDMKRCITTCKRVPRVVERTVSCCHMVSTCVVDPCTGCSHTVCRPEIVLKKVCCTVYDLVPETHEIIVRVCCPKPVEQNYECRRIVCDIKTETVTRKERFCVMVPYQTTVKLPVCTPVCNTCCN